MKNVDENPREGKPSSFSFQQPEVDTPVVELTVVETDDPSGLLAKEISLDPATGRPVSDGGACAMSSGRARRGFLDADDPAGALGRVLNGMTSREALTSGRMVDAVLADEAEIVVKDELGRRANGDAAGKIARTKDYFEWSPGPGFVLLDYDQGGMPDSVRARIEELGGPLAALRWLIGPELFDRIARVYRESTSAGVYNAETGEEYPGSGGFHLYLLLADQRWARRLLDYLQAKAWLNALGWIKIARDGKALTRSLVDVAVGSPERLIFVGKPRVLPPLAQRPRRAEAFPGEPLDASGFALTAEETARFQHLVAEEKKRLQPDIKRAEEAWLDENGARFGPGAAEALRAARDEGRLAGDVPLTLDDGTVATVAEVLKDRDRFDKKTCADPFDDKQRRNKAILYLKNKDGGGRLYSQLGGVTYQLEHTPESVRAVLEKAGAGAKDIFVELIAGADFGPIVKDELLTLVQKLTKLGKRALKDELKRAQAKAKTAKARAERAAARDLRPTLRAPDPDGERSPVAREVEKVLLAVDPPETFQNVAGEVVKVAARSSELLHRLTSETAGGGVHRDLFLRAPEAPVIEPHSVESFRALVERRARHVVDDGQGQQRVVTLPDPFLRFILAPREGCRLPLLVALSSVPVVTPEGRLIVAGGYDARSGIYFTCSEEEARALVPRDTSPEAVEAAYRYLAEEVLADVAFENREHGTAALVALLLTLIAQPVLSEKPIWSLSAPQRGSGKTTIVNIASMAVLGRPAAAAAWSKSDEERRKALFAAAREGHGLLPLDNIERGTTIRDTTIERFSTAAEVRDRVLGESRTQAVRSPVVVLTGNAINLSGDAASRALQVELKADRPDPENRPFKHPDILGWVARNRPSILRACLTLILGNPTLKDPAAKIETRFKGWYVLVGSAVEHGARLADLEAKMVEIIRAGEEEDETAVARRELLELLQENFTEGKFKVADLVNKINGGGDTGAALKEAVDALASKPLDVFTGRTVGVVLEKHVARVPIEDADGKWWKIAPEARKSKSKKTSPLWEIRDGATDDLFKGDM